MRKIIGKSITVKWDYYGGTNGIFVKGCPLSNPPLEIVEQGNIFELNIIVIAGHLTKLGLEVKYPVAKTGAIGILRTGKPGPVIALRADIDGLPVVERNSLAFALSVEYLNKPQK